MLIDTAEVRARNGWPAEQLDAATALGLPEAFLRVRHQTGAKPTPAWVRQAERVDEWTTQFIRLRPRVVPTAPFRQAGRSNSIPAAAVAAAFGWTLEELNLRRAPLHMPGTHVRMVAGPLGIGIPTVCFWGHELDRWTAALALLVT